MTSFDLLSDHTNDKDISDFLSSNTIWDNGYNDTKMNMDAETTALDDEYTEFIEQLSQYISSKTTDIISLQRSQHDFIHELFNIIYSYIAFNINLLTDFSEEHKDIASDTKINCMDIAALFCDRFNQTHLWFTTDNNLILGYDFKTNEFIGKYDSYVWNIYSFDKPNGYGPITNIKSFCLRHRNIVTNNGRKFILFLANNGYDTVNFAYTNHINCVRAPDHNRLALIRDSHVGKCLCNYLVSELYYLYYGLD